MADDVVASYRVLGLQSGATLEQVRRAYRTLIKTWHPDRFPNDDRLRAQAHAKAAELGAAYARVREHLRNTQASSTPQHAHPSSPTPTQPPQKTASVPKPDHIPGNGSLASVSVIAGAMGLVLALLPAAVVILVTAPTRGADSGRGIVAGASLLALLAGSAALLGALLSGSRHSHIVAGSAFLFSVAVSFAAAATASAANDASGEGIAIALYAAVLTLPLVAVAVALGILIRVDRGTLVGLCSVVPVTALAVVLNSGRAAAHVGQPMAASLSLLMYVAVLAATVIGARDGGRSARRMALGLSTFSTVVGFVAFLAVLGESARVHQSIVARGLGLCAVSAGLTAMAGDAFRARSRQDWRAGTDGLALGITDITAGLVLLMWCS